jgi:hypothetical protein
MKRIIGQVCENFNMMARCDELLRTIVSCCSYWVTNDYFKAFASASVQSLAPTLPFEVCGGANGLAGARVRVRSAQLSEKLNGLEKEAWWSPVQASAEIIKTLKASAEVQQLQPAEHGRALPFISLCLIYLSHLRTSSFMEDLPRDGHIFCLWWFDSVIVCFKTLVVRPSFFRPLIQAYLERTDHRCFDAMGALRHQPLSRCVIGVPAYFNEVLHYSNEVSAYINEPPALLSDEKP